jgi:Helix-hairpin-helix motif
MPTPAERKALLFVSCVAVLGAGVRAVRAAGGGRVTTEGRAALERQIAAAESAGGVRARGAGRRAADKSRVTRDGWDGGPDAGQGSVAAPRSVTRRASRVRAGRAARDSAPSPPVVSVLDRVDLDVASAADIERLPRIGPALARRIVADRDSLGPFGSLEGLARVRGVGPAVLRAIAPRVTFSRTPRPTGAEPGGGSGHRRPRARGRGRKTGSDP